MDALFGVGLKRPVEGDFLAAVRWMNGRRAPVVSCDLPSGVDGDTGEVLGEAVQARTTVTFTCAKPGTLSGAGAGCAGRCRRPTSASPGPGPPDDMAGPGADRAKPGLYALWSSPPAGGRPQGDFGKVYSSWGGSEGYTGAPIAGRPGPCGPGRAGLCGVPREVYPIVAVKCEEAMAFPLPEEIMQYWKRPGACDVAVIGPGLGRHPQTERLVRSLLE